MYVVITGNDLVGKHPLLSHTIYHTCSWDSLKALSHIPRNGRLGFGNNGDLYFTQLV